MNRSDEPLARHATQESPEVKLDRMINELNSQGNSRKKFSAMLTKANGKQVEVIMTGALHRAGSPVQLVDVSPRAATGYPRPLRTVFIQPEALAGG